MEGGALKSACDGEYEGCLGSNTVLPGHKQLQAEV